MRRILGGLTAAVVVAALLPLLGAAPAAAATFRAGLTDILVADGLGAPTAVAQLPDGRMLVTSQEGKLWLVRTNGVASVALDLAAPPSKICTGSEQGLLGVTIEPNLTNGWIYLFYTSNGPNASCAGNNNPNGAQNRVSRFALTGDTVERTTELILLDNMPTWGTNHNGGDVRVANDGTLFVSVGDGGGGSPASNASNLSLPNGKILRINRDGSIPSGNPYGSARCGATWGQPGTVCGEIWADGLRNPFRLGFDVSAPGARFRINDVGFSAWEEVDEAFAGAHYGWPCREGPGPGPAPGSGCLAPFTEPVLFYNHSTGCSVETGGAFVPQGAWRGFEGAYIWVDFGCGQLYLALAGEAGTPAVTIATGMNGTTDLEFFPVAGGYSLFYTTFASGGELHRVNGSIADRWESLGGALSAGPAATSWSAGRLDVVVKGADNQLWHKFFQNGWSGFAPLGGAVFDGPAVVSWGPGRLDVFARGLDNQLWHKWYEGGWSAWEPLGGGLTSGPAAASWTAGRLDVFVRGHDHQLWHKWYEGRWSGWEPLGGGLVNGPAATSWSAGRLDVFARGGDDQLWHKFFHGGWSGWQPLGGGLASGPAATSWSPGRLDVFVKGTDNQLWRMWWQGGWSAWQPLGGVLADGPAASSWAPGRLDVFVRSVDNQLWHKWYGGSWI